ncbi:hypothetical protein TRIUR3_29934 [Triticum urartu]|uniref:Uncharacterized protein n=1 Tax=Triticum urartu TaxID=4572 RepID=M8A4F6_TRIUA|nr:hypothetical protein TRIUR3_29934 [Triticum urartu]
MSNEVWGWWHSSGGPVEQRKGGPRGEDRRSAAQTAAIDGWTAVLMRLTANGLPAPRGMEGVAALEAEQAATTMNPGCERVPSNWRYGREEGHSGRGGRSRQQRRKVAEGRIPAMGENLDSDRVGRCGGEHPTHAFFLRVRLHLGLVPAYSFVGYMCSSGHDCFDHSMLRRRNWVDY